MYVDASEMCNNIVFQLGQSGMGAAIATRKWSIKVIQKTSNISKIRDHRLQQQKALRKNGIFKAKTSKADLPNRLL